MRLLLFLAAVTAVTVGSLAQSCHRGCVCTRRTVQCMHQELETVPHVPADTLILDLRFNRIRDIPPGAFSNLPHLTTLLLNNNHLVSLRNGAFEGLPNLRFLYLYKNRIHHLDDGAFSGLKRLEKLYLHLNEISEFNREVFSNLTSLERLFLHGNKIKSIPVGSFDNLNSLKRLRLDSNALVCDCSILWLLKMVNEKNLKGKKFEAAAVCQYPEEMRGISLNSVEMNDLHCEKPYIKHGPKDVEINFGGTAIFKCQVSGDPTPEVIWMKNSAEIPANDPKYKIMKDGSLMIENSVESDVGVFECMAKSPLGLVKSNVARMVLQNSQKDEYSKIPPQFSILPDNKTIKVSDKSVALHCLAKGKPQPHIIWYHNDKRILLSEKINVYRNGTVKINNLEMSDSGQYKCEAENVHGKISALAQVRLLESPILKLSYEPLQYRAGDDLNLKCEAKGVPTPTITWFKNENTLQTSPRITVDDSEVNIRSISEVDTGDYMCRGENSEGFKEETVEISVTSNTDVESDNPQIIYKPYDIDTLPGSKIELPCLTSSNVPVSITWKKDGSHLIRTNRHKISAGGNLYITNVTVNDGGRYECTASNSFGSVSAFGLITIKDLSDRNPGNQFVKIAFAEAVQEVDNAINKTVESLFGNRDVRPDMGELYRIVRFPSAPERQLARAAEIYERTLVNIRYHVNKGKMVNFTSNFNYREILSPEHINLVAKLSGCMAHRLTTNCTNYCFHLKFRSIDGTCNNLQHPMWGASSVGFRRLLKPIYENGFNQPVGWDKGLKYNGYELPNPRVISSTLISTNEITPDEVITHMVMQWGQFLDHDLDHATPSVTSQSWDGIDCKRSCEYAAPCFPIDIPKNDHRISNRRCIDFIRSSSVCGSGMTSVFFNEIQPREQINQLTAFIDASQVYGYAENIAEDLRNLTTNDGLLRNGVTYPGRKPLLPFSSAAQQMDCRGGALESDIKCFVAGDIRANEQVGLLAMHTLWFREHNRIAFELKGINPHWNGDRLYHEARKIVGAQMQHITYEHWLPIILGPSGMEKLNSGNKEYDPNLDPTIANVFATAALRFGHSLINPVLHRFDEDFNEIEEGHLPLHKAFFASWRVAEEGGIDPLLRGLYTIPAKLKTPGQNLNSELTEKLFHVAHAVALDLAAINIQRSRDHAIPSYTEWRRLCNMSDVQDFEELKNEISDVNVRKKLKELYGSVHNIDVWVGGILEDQVKDGKVGPLFQCLLVDQFRRLRNGDRFWFEHKNVFTPEQQQQIKLTSLGRVLCDNGDNIAYVTDNVFILPEKQDGLIDCDDIRRINLIYWADCSDCEGGVCVENIQENVSRQRREIKSQILKDKENKLMETIIAIPESIEKLEKMIANMKKKIKDLEKSCTNQIEDIKT